MQYVTSEYLFLLQIFHIHYTVYWVHVGGADREGSVIVCVSTRMVQLKLQIEARKCAWQRHSLITITYCIILYQIRLMGGKTMLITVIKFTFNMFQTKELLIKSQLFIPNWNLISTVLSVVWTKHDIVTLKH